jgi:signal transduction histidine kinase
MPEKLIRDQESLQLVEKLIRRVVHDLSNPLSAVVGFAELLSYPNMTPEKKERFAEQILQQATKARTILETMARFCDLGDTSNIERFSLKNIVQTTLALRRSAHQSDGVEVIIDIDDKLQVVAQRDNVGKIVHNLVVNSEQAFVFFDYGAEKRIHISVTILPESQMCALDIMDNAGGVAPGSEDLIFEPFYSGRKSGGLGLGLYVSRGLAQAFRGDLQLLKAVDLTSVDYPGAAFRLTLPIQEG